MTPVSLRHPLLAGDMIHGSGYRSVEHCVGPLGLATLILKAIRHLTAVEYLPDTEAAESGPLRNRTSTIVKGLVADADQAGRNGPTLLPRIAPTRTGGSFPSPRRSAPS